MLTAVFAPFKKTPVMKIAGVFLCLVLSLPGAADCGRPSGSLLTVTKISDGDTLTLADGRSIRVLGMNAPEMARGRTAAQPLAREARAAAQAFVQRAGGKVRLGFERERQDHYGRWLAHVYDASGRSLAADLLRQGFALQIAVPPNTLQAECLQGFERQARQRGRGVWKNAYWNAYPAEKLTPTETGFRHLRGRVSEVAINSSVWLELEGHLVVQIAKRDWPQFGYSQQEWQGLKGKQIEVRGWIVAPKGRAAGKHKPLLLPLRSLAALQVSTSAKTN